MPHTESKTSRTARQRCRARMRLPWAKSSLYADFGLGVKYFLFPNLSDDSARVPDREHPVRDVLGDDAPSADDGLRPDLHSGADNRSAANPNVRTNLDRFGELLRSAQVGVHRMGGRVNLDGRAEQS